MSDTPRTDAQLKAWGGGEATPVFKALSDHARTLERELAEAKARTDEVAKEAAKQIAGDLARIVALSRSHAALREALADARYALHSAGGFYITERNVARAINIMDAALASQGNTEPGKPFHTEANARRLLAFRDHHATDNYAEAWNSIYWMVSDNAKDIYHPWAELEALVPGAQPGDFLVNTPTRRFQRNEREP